MSWTYLPVVVGSWRDSGLKGGAPYAMWSGLDTRLRLLREESWTGSLMMRLSGMMLELLMEDPGAGGWMSLRQGFLASRSAERERCLGEMTQEMDGLTPFALLERSGPDSFFWRTWQRSLPGLMDTMDEFSETWPKAGIMLDGVCYRRLSWERPIGESESGLWRTPTSGEARRGRSSKDSNGNLHLSVQVHSWPTPTVNGNNNRKGLTEKSGDGLATAVKEWPTPTASDTRNRKAANPIVTGNGTIRHRNKAGGQSFMHLSQVVHAVEQFPTPTATDATKWNNKTVAERKAKGQSVRLHNKAAPGDGGRLNPDWVEWLMDWPVGWTSLEPLPKENFYGWLKANMGWQEAGSEEIQIDGMFPLWWQTEPSAASQRRGCDQQRPCKCCDNMPVVSHGNACEARELGQRSSKDCHMCDLQERISAEENTARECVRELGMSKGVGPVVCKETVEWLNVVPRVANDVENRVERLKAIGNGEVPVVAKAAWDLLVEDFFINGG